MGSAEAGLAALPHPVCQLFERFGAVLKGFFWGESITTRRRGTHTRECVRKKKTKKNVGVLKADCCTALSFSLAARNRLLVHGLTSRVLYRKTRQGYEFKTPRIILTIEHRAKRYFRIILIYYRKLPYFCISRWGIVSGYFVGRFGADSKCFLLVSFWPYKCEVAFSVPRRERRLYS